MTLWNGALLAFLLFAGLLALFIGWAFTAGQNALDRQFQADDEAWREALRRWPP